MMRLAIAIGVLILICGCGLLPRTVQEPQIHNPFPQLTKVAVAPFFNLSSEPTVDGRQFGGAYFAALQSIPGFEVIPIGVVEQAAKRHGLQLNGPDQARQLAQLVGADAIVIGAVTDFSPYYPPRCGIQIEWYATNPGFHPVPPGYGLPWGTTEEEYIPPSLKLEAEMALAREQLATQTPQQTDANGTPVPTQSQQPHEALVLPAVAVAPAAVLTLDKDKKEGKHQPGSQQSQQADSNVVAASASANANGNAGTAASAAATASGAPNSNGFFSTTGTAPIAASDFPPNWPDPRGFIPPPPSLQRPPYIPSNEPVMRHARIYSGNDADFTAAMENYIASRDDARKDGWKGTLQRSDEFIRFCCYKSIAEMLTARGGGGESRVVYRWESGR
jgi:hypothetical protein